MIDTHAHLFMCKKPLSELVKEAQEAGVSAIINVATDLESAQKTRDSHTQYPWIYPTIGLYPSEAENTQDLDTMYTILSETHPYVAIGEIGLDYYRVTVPADSQKQCFIQQLNFAREFQLPVIIHNRHADDDLIAIMKNFKDVKAVFHCFSSAYTVAQALASDEHYFSFTGMITYQSKGKTIKTIQQLPLEKIMLETDCPYLTPKYYQGNENQPAYLLECAKKIAEVHDRPFEDIVRITTQTAKHFFSI